MSNAVLKLRLKDGDQAPEQHQRASSDKPPWKLLIVDDEDEVHSVTRLALGDFRFAGRGLEFISAYSGAEAKECISQDPEIAVMLLDVVMESDDAGLKVVQYTRQVLGNNFVRIILRTGHPGLAPERKVITAYDINDYRAKTELTQDRMFALMHNSLAAYQRLSGLAASRRQLAMMNAEYKEAMDRLSQRLELPNNLLGQALVQLRDFAEKHQLRLPETSLTAAEKQAKTISQVLRALRRLSSLQDEDIQMKNFPLERAWQEAQAQLSEEIAQRHAKFSQEELPELYGNEELIRECFKQLIRNSLQNASDDTPHLHLSAEASGRYWQFRMCDNGTGIPVDKREELFQAFQQLAESKLAGRPGMGLSVCRKIMAIHGGKIWAESPQHSGACIVMSLPSTGESNEPI